MEYTISTYGNKQGEGKGIERFTFKNGIFEHENLIPLNGKSNLVLEYNDLYLTSVSNAEGNTLRLYSKDGKLIQYYVTEYMYSFGQIVGTNAILGSYSNGHDSVYDIENNKIISQYHHTRVDKNESGKTHYIHRLEDGRIISIDNQLEQIYVYSDLSLENPNIINFDERKGIRLARFKKNLAYINTEQTNELLTVNTDDFKIVKADTLILDCTNNYSGGLDINEDQSLLAVSVRGVDIINIYALDIDGNTKLLYSFSCGNTPRDLKFDGNYLLVSCTNDYTIEAYQLDETKAELISKFSVNQPITFGTK